MKQERIPIKNVFTQDEMVDLGKELGLVEIKKAEVEADKKVVMKSYKTKLDGMNVQITELSDKLNNGFEMIDTLCEVRFDFVHKVRQYYRASDGEFLYDEALRKEDYQFELELGGTPITSVKDDEVF